MAISEISRSMGQHYEKLSTMKRINSASDDAAGAAIVSQLTSQKNGYDVGKNNARTGQDLLRTAEGGLSSVQDSLSRMRELSIQASNGIYTDSDREAMQEEINGLKATIQDAAKGTQFNTMKLLDGSYADKNIALNPDGSGIKINIQNTTLQSLGIADFDVTKKFDTKMIDDAIQKVNESRGDIGAQYNALGYASDYNSVASQNLTAARSRIEDLDVGKAVSEKEKDRVMLEYGNFARMEKIKNSQLGINKMLGI